MKMNKKGFTLIEMLVVIAIIAVLVSIIVPAVGSSTTKAKASTDAANLRSVLSAATIEYASKGLSDVTTGEGASATTTQQLTLEVNVPAAKSVTASTIEVYMEGDVMNAYYVNGTNYYSIAAFAVVAEGKEVDGKVVTSVTAGTAPSGTKVCTISGLT